MLIKSFREKGDEKMAVVLIIAGAVIFVGSFVFAAINMGRQAKKVFGSNVDEAFTGFGGTFTRHLGAMIGMVVGGLIGLTGLILGAVQLAQSILH